MPRNYQNGKLEVRRDVKRPYYFVRVSVPVIDALPGERKQIRQKRALGFLDDIPKKRTWSCARNCSKSSTRAAFWSNPKILFKDLVERFVEVHLPQFGVATRAQYRSQIDNHIVPAFGEQKL